MSHHFYEKRMLHKPASIYIYFEEWLKTDNTEFLLSEESFSVFSAK